MANLISQPRTVIPACDVDVSRFEKLIKETANVEKIGAYKIGMLLGLSHGLPKIVEIARKYTNKPLIYDHQKAATDIPDTGKEFARIIQNAGIDAVILFPQAGPATLTAWTQRAMEKGLTVIVGGHMTHDRYLASEGGYIADESIERIYLDAAKLGVVDFVVPGNRPSFIIKIREKIIGLGIQPVFYAPGFIAQGGKISDAAKVAGPKWHAIVGRAIYDEPDMRQSAVTLAASI
ncbi:MAG: orotidine 5'-phosphate decarboxylase [Deltaproteobacteria bacterium]|nr:orotidine 5'-phosphate decarboxylase [Deltaproteobacteria bacterium]